MFWPLFTRLARTGGAGVAAPALPPFGGRLRVLFRDVDTIISSSSGTCSKCAFGLNLSQPVLLAKDRTRPKLIRGISFVLSILELAWEYDVLAVGSVKETYSI
jgi:hypothetical protein